MQESNKLPASVMQSIIEDVKELTTSVLQEFGDQLVQANPECSSHVTTLLGTHDPFADIFPGPLQQLLAAEIFPSTLL